MGKSAANFEHVGGAGRFQILFIVNTNIPLQNPTLKTSQRTASVLQPLIIEDDVNPDSLWQHCINGARDEIPRPKAPLHSPQTQS
jgi:hypothetical protein